MNFKQTRRIEHFRKKKKKKPFYLEQYKNDPKCIETRTRFRQHVPEFERCGNGAGYVYLICDGCPFH